MGLSVDRFLLLAQQNLAGKIPVIVGMGLDIIQLREAVDRGLALGAGKRRGDEVMVGVQAMEIAAIRPCQARTRASFHAAGEMMSTSFQNSHAKTCVSAP